MNLFVHLVLRLLGVVLLCLACAIGWMLVDTHRAIETQTVASADRVAHTLETLYWRELVWNSSLRRNDLLPVPDWQTLKTMTVISPGICITFAPDGEASQRLCSQLDTVGSAAPAWFRFSYDRIFGGAAPVERPLTVRRPEAGVIVAAADPDAAVRQAWDQVRLMVSVATLLAIGIGVLAALSIGQSLMPARTIVAGLRRLEKGDYSYRLPAYRTAEFSHIARAVNDLDRSARRHDGAARGADQPSVPGAGGGAPGARPRPA